jgi:hypothetical protein
MTGALILGAVLMAVVFIGVPLGAALLEWIATLDLASARIAGVEMARTLGGEYLAEISCGALAIATSVVYSGLVRVDRRKPEPSQTPLQ